MLPLVIAIKMPLWFPNHKGHQRAMNCYCYMGTATQQRWRTGINKTLRESYVHKN